MTRSLLVVCVAMLSLVVSGRAAAQAVRATVLGTVTDRTGGVLPGATVNVTNIETGVAQSTVADSQGRYAVTKLLPAATTSKRRYPDFRPWFAAASGWSSAARPSSISRLGRLRCRKPSR